MVLVSDSVTVWTEGLQLLHETVMRCRCWCRPGHPSQCSCTALTALTGPEDRHSRPHCILRLQTPDVQCQCTTVLSVQPPPDISLVMTTIMTINIRRTLCSNVEMADERGRRLRAQFPTYFCNIIRLAYTIKDGRRTEYFLKYLHFMSQVL